MESTRVALYALPAGIKEEIRSYSCGISKSTDVPSEVDSETGVIRIHKENSLLHFACSLCHRVFKTLEEQKLHYKSEEHLNEVKKAIFQDEESSDSEDEDALEVVEDGCLLTVCLPSANVTIYKRLLESGLSNREVSASQFALEWTFLCDSVPQRLFHLGHLRQGNAAGESTGEALHDAP